MNTLMSSSARQRRWAIGVPLETSSLYETGCKREFSSLFCLKASQGWPEERKYRRRRVILKEANFEQMVQHEKQKEEKAPARQCGGEMWGGSEFMFMCFGQAAGRPLLPILSQSVPPRDFLL